SQIVVPVGETDGAALAMAAESASAPSKASGRVVIPHLFFAVGMCRIRSVPRGLSLTTHLRSSWHACCTLPKKGPRSAAVAGGGLVQSHKDREGQSPLRYMPQLDALRALAAFGVFVQHFVASGNVFATTIPLGDLGVRLFFVLSGFLITGILLTARANVAQSRLSLGAVVGHFYARRFLRLAPLYFVFLALMFLVIPEVRTHAPWFLGYAQNVHFAVEDEFTVAPHLWTLAVEEQFYLFWPLVVLLVPAKRLLPVVAAIAALGVVSRLAAPLFGLTHFQASMLTPSHFDSLGLGALLAVAAASERFAASALHR